MSPESTAVSASINEDVSGYDPEGDVRASLFDRGHKRKTTQSARGGCFPCQSRPADVVSLFPSGSQFRHPSLSTSIAPDRAQIISSKTKSRLEMSSRAAPAPFTHCGGSGVRTGVTSDSGLCEQSTVLDRSEVGLNHLSRVEEEEQMMDALFGGENMDGVVEQGESMFGFDAGQQIREEEEEEIQSNICQAEQSNRHQQLLAGRQQSQNLSTLSHKGCGVTTTSASQLQGTYNSGNAFL